jgi:SAM-dependent methyltransferase
VRTRNDILADANRDLPRGIDWRAGARRYVEHYVEEWGRTALEHYSFGKPLAVTPQSGHQRALEENVAYLCNFVNVVQLLRLEGGARIMDVACGGGWFSHFLTRMGYSTFGFDISDSFVALAARRLRNDPLCGLSDQSIEKMFTVHDIEAGPLPAQHDESYDAIILESCLHHFLDPITTISNLARCLNAEGLLIVVEGENRAGALRNEYLKVMAETETLERPYPRRLLQEIYEVSGLPHYEFFGNLNGWFSPDDPASGHLAEQLRDRAQCMNLSVCAKSAGALAKKFPWLANGERRLVRPLGGIFEAVDGWRWSEMRSQIRALVEFPVFAVDISSEVPRLTGRPQQVFVHGRAGLLTSLQLTKESPVGRVEVRDVRAGDELTFTSGDFFVPARHGLGTDLRELAFAVRLPETATSEGAT